MVREGDNAYAWVVKEGKLRKVALTLGERDARTGAYAIKSGLAEGDQVLRFPNVSLKEDQVVNFDDLLVVAQNYGQQGRTFSQGNFNYDGPGAVDFDDLLILAQNYGTTSAVSVSKAGARGRDGLTMTGLRSRRMSIIGSSTSALMSDE